MRGQATELDLVRDVGGRPVWASTEERPTALQSAPMIVGGTKRRASVLAATLLCACGGCFPTFQSARVQPGFHVDASAILLADQRRNSGGAPVEVAQGPTIIGVITPAYGIGRRFELGLPIGVYTGSGDDNSILVMPYAKLALLDADSKNHLSVSTQFGFVLPSNIGVHYGRDLGAWEPQVGVSFMRSGGPANDDPVITRYQQANQSLAVGSFAATFNRPRRPAIEIGVLRNSYDTPSTPPVRRTLYDMFVGFRLGVTR